MDSLNLALALGWHSVDAVMHMSVPHRRSKALWAGVGVGWALFWLIKNYTGTRYVTTKSR